MIKMDKHNDFDKSQFCNNMIIFMFQFTHRNSEKKNGDIYKFGKFDLRKKASALLTLTI